MLRRRMWWIVLLGTAAAGGLAVTVATVRLLVERADGRRHLREVLARVEREQRGSSAEDILADAPHVHTGVQERCYEWMHGRPQAWIKPRVTPTQLNAWVLGFADQPDALLSEREEWRTAAAAFDDLLRAPDLRLGGMGWIRQDLPRTEATPYQIMSVRVSNLLMVRRLAEWYGRAALLEADPRPWLASLDRLPLLLTPGFIVIDAMLEIAVMDLRDEAYLRVAARGALPSETAEAWLDEPPRAERCLAPALRTERIIASLAGAAALEGSLDYGMFEMMGRISGADPEAPDPTSRRVRSLLAAHVRGPEGAARVIESFLYCEDLLRTGRPDGTPPWMDGDWGTKSYWPFDMLLPNLSGVLATVTRQRAEHRMARITALLLLRWREGYDLPASEAELRTLLGPRASWLDAGPYDVALRYERLTATRVRFAPDPRSPAPLGLTADDLDLDRTSYGTPPAPTPAQWDSPGYETDLARLPRSGAQAGDPRPEGR